jgi:hypothetical protein
MLVTGEGEQETFITAVFLSPTPRHSEWPRHALTSGKKHTQKMTRQTKQKTICNWGHSSFPALFGTLFDPCRLAYLTYTSNDCVRPHLTMNFPT